MGLDKSKLFQEVAYYYAEKIEEYGNTPRGVDWNGEESQLVRFVQLCKIIDPKMPNFSVNDLGCGYGALLDYLRNNQVDCKYLGVDICHEMIMSAEKRHGASDKIRFTISSEPDEVADYGMASGIFNVRLGRTDTEWFEYIIDTLNVLDRTSRFGFSFNCLSSYSDLEKRQDYLYYSDPCILFDLCKRNYSREVALLHDYDHYEFTILVKKFQ